MKAPLSTSACSSAVRVSALVKLSGAKLAAIVSKTLKCGFAALTSGLFMPSIRAAVAFLAAYFFMSSNSSKSKLRIADAHRGDGKRFVVRADEKLTAFLELQSVIRAASGWLQRLVRCIGCLASATEWQD